MKLQSVGLFGRPNSLDELDLGEQVRAMAKEAGFTDEDLEMIEALGNSAIYSGEAVERRWQQDQAHRNLTVVA